MTFQQEIEAKANSLGLLTDCISSGPTTAEIAFISTSPGEVEAQTKKPFTGGSGTYLWNTVHKVCGLNRNNVYATNVVKRFTGKTFNEDEQRINKHELSLWISLLHWELSRLPNLKYVVILGAEALDALMNEKGITNWRGSIVNINIGSRTVQGLVTFNPALVTRMNSMLRKKHVVVPVRNADYIFKLDIAKLRALLAGRLSPYTITHHINPTLSEALDFIADLQRAKDPVSFDIETFANETACIGFANKNDAGMCIPFYSSTREHYWDAHDELVIRKAVQGLLADRNVPLVAQNGIFDCIWLWYKDRIRTNPLYMDTLLAHHTLYPTLPHSLQFLTAQYTTHPYYKDDKSGWQKDEDADRFWRYNVTDACVTLAVSQVLDRKLAKEKMDGFFYNHVMAAQPHLIELCIRGFKCDVGYKQIVTSHFEADLSRTLDEFHRACQLAVNDPEYTPNPASPKQMGELYFRKLKLVGRSTSTNAENRNYMAEHPNTSAIARQVIDLHNVYQKQAKFLGTYLGSEVDDDGRLRTEYKQFGTQRAPGRLSSSQTPWGTGMNFQNQPQAAYPMFVADEGMCLLYFDLSQAEARVVGWLANIDKWIADFERARRNPGTFDCHCSLASDMFNVRYDEVPTFDRNPDGSFTIRFVAKRCRHGLNYRMMADRLATTTGLTLSEAYKAFHLYHKINPELMVWWEIVERQVRDNGVLFSPLGRRLTFHEQLTENVLESIIAFKPQSTVGDKVVSVIYKSQEDDDWPSDANILLNNHDALIAQAPFDKAKTCLRIMKKHAEEPIIIVPDRDRHKEVPPLIIPADMAMTTVGTSWKIDNNGKTEFYSDELGFHRWSDLKKVQI